MLSSAQPTVTFGHTMPYGAQGARRRWPLGENDARPDRLLVGRRAPAAGPAILTITGLPSLPALGVHALDSRQLRIAEETFASFRDWTLLPANEA